MREPMYEFRVSTEMREPSGLVGVGDKRYDRAVMDEARIRGDRDHGQRMGLTGAARVYN